MADFKKLAFEFIILTLGYNLLEMITINKKVKISKTTQKIEFDVANLPEGEYTVQLLIGENGEIATGKDYSLENWSSGIQLDPLPKFRREDMYGDYGR